MQEFIKETINTTPVNYSGEANGHKHKIYKNSVHVAYKRFKNENMNKKI